MVTQAEKANAVGLAEVVGIRPAGRQLGIAESTLRGWHEEPALAQLRAEKREEVAADVWAAFQVGVRRVADLLPLTKDVQHAAVATGILYDKFALMTGEPTSRLESKALTDDLGDDEKQRLREWIDSITTTSEPAARTPG